jgi:hypothetical protein
MKQILNQTGVIFHSPAHAAVSSGLPVQAQRNAENFGEILN